MAERRTMSDCFFCLVLVWALIGATSSSNQECDAWANLARKLTGNGHTQVCDNSHTSKCTRFDCEGIFRVHPSFGSQELDPIALDYCFGSQINPCSTPLSMNFYISLPEKNFSRKVLVEHNEKVSLTSLKIPFGKLGEASPVFLFELQKEPNGFIQFAVTLKVQLKVAAFGTEVYLPRLEQTIVNATSIPAENCTKSQNAASPFEIGSCHETKQPVTSKPTKRPYVIPHVEPSYTLHQRCDPVDHACSHGEVCDPRFSKCSCDPDFKLSLRLDACISYSKLEGPCESNADCGLNEECTSKDSNGFVCKCLRGYEFDAERELCSLPHHVIVPTHSNAAVDKTTAKPVHSSDSHKGINKLIIIFASIGAVVLILLVVMGFICYRRRRNVIHVNFNESDQPLLNSMGDENDMNIIM